jgi:transposase-like protein
MSSGQWRDAHVAWKKLGVWLNDRITGPGSRDREPAPLDALGHVGTVRRTLDEVELRAVRCARQRGKSWAEIATRLGVTRQSAWEKWRDLDESPAADEPAAAVAVPESDEVWLAAEREIGRLRRRSKRVTVPNVVGQSLVVARRELAGRGLMAASGDPEGVLDMAPSGSVVTDQSPESGASVPPGTRVLLSVDRGEGGVREPRRPRPDPLPARKYLPDPADEAVG